MYDVTPSTACPPTTSDAPPLVPDTMPDGLVEPPACPTAPPARPADDRTLGIDAVVRVMLDTSSAVEWYAKVGDGAWHAVVDGTDELVLVDDGDVAAERYEQATVLFVKALLEGDMAANATRIARSRAVRPNRVRDGGIVRAARDGNVTFADLVGAASGRDDPEGCVLRLVAERVLEFDLSRPLRPDTPFTPRAT